MYLFALTTYPNEQQKDDNYEMFKEEQNWYFGALIKNGQVLANDCNTIFEDNWFTTYFLAPEQDSLDLNNANQYVNECHEKLLSLCASNPQIKLLGKSSDYESACSCDSSTWYMLYTDYTTNESPIVCGDCGHSVPLYKLPKILGEDEYFTVFSWQKAYNACDRLFMEGFGERFAYQKISKVTSDLSQKGREICLAFEKETGKPFYYYLFRYYSSHKSNCPICGEIWKLENDESFIDFRCDHCRLVGDKK